MTTNRLRWALVGVIVALLAAMFARSHARETRRFEREERTRAAMADASLGVPGVEEVRDAGALIEHTTRDPAVRDDVRRRIYQSWSAQGPANAPAQADPLHAPMPVLANGSVDPNYLRTRIREDFVPMAQVCYESFGVRHPNIGGRVMMAFKIIGDEHIGGVIDEATVGDAASDAGAEAAPGAPGVFDAEFVTCLRESLLTVAFQPPPHSGTITVHYPLTLSPDAPDAAAH